MAESQISKVVEGNTLEKLVELKDASFDIF
jgi:hypothetical protein